MLADTHRTSGKTLNEDEDGYNVKRSPNGSTEPKRTSRVADRVADSTSDTLAHKPSTGVSGHPNGCVRRTLDRPTTLFFATSERFTDGMMRRDFRSARGYDACDRPNIGTRPHAPADAGARKGVFKVLVLLVAFMSVNASDALELASYSALTFDAAYTQTYLPHREANPWRRTTAGNWGMYAMQCGLVYGINRTQPRWLRIAFNAVVIGYTAQQVVRNFHHNARMDQQGRGFR
jgi:hypothetical protein